MIDRQQRWTNGRRARVVVGLLLAIGFVIQCQQFAVDHSPQRSVRVVQPPSNAAYASVKIDAPSADPFEAMAKSDPMQLLRTAMDRYSRSVHDYTCTFTKQEWVGGKLTAEQVTRVKFREKPYSVDMTWVRNADKAKRVVYIEGQWTNKAGERLALCEPAGAIASLLVDSVMRPIDGADAKKAARRRIDQFGFGMSLKLILQYSDKAARRNELELKYLGQGEIEDRPTYILERRLPYDGDEDAYPDRVLVVHLDKENLMPIGCFAYADDAKTKLLGSYVITDVQYNVGLSDADFLGGKK